MVPKFFKFFKEKNLLPISSQNTKRPNFGSMEILGLHLELGRIEGFVFILHKPH
jgi:hypothetical protein